MDKETLSLLEGYLEKAKEKLETAKYLLEKKRHDDVVSRAYYACFHATQAVLLSEGLEANTHRGLLNLFGLHFVRTGKFDKKFGRILSNLKDDRENGDYEIYSAIDQEVAEEAVQEAEEFLKEAEKHLGRYLKKKV